MSKNRSIEQIISLVFMIRKIMHGNLSQRKKQDVSFLQLVMLHYIKENSPLMKELAKFLKITPSSATSFVNTLKRKKLVERKPEKRDRRIVRIILSPQGKKYLKTGKSQAIQVMKKGLIKLNQKEQTELVEILKKITSK